MKALALCASLTGALLSLYLQQLPVLASAPVTLASGSNGTRATIPVTIDGRRADCVLDTGSSAILVSPWLAQEARLAGGAGTFEVAPDGRTHVDRQTRIARFGVAQFTLNNVPALISSNLTGYSALCGYDFFLHFPSLIDRERQAVTLFPAPAKLTHMRCLPIGLAPHVPVATIEINGTWVDGIVLDSGMVGGGALWDGVRARLARPLDVSSRYQASPAALRDGFSCGVLAYVRFGGGAYWDSMPICTEAIKPDGYNGILETNLPGVHAMAVDYPHHRMCFDVSGYSTIAPAHATYAAARGNAWSRFNYLRPP